MALRPDGTDQDEFDSYGGRRKRRKQGSGRWLVYCCALPPVLLLCLALLGAGGFLLYKFVLFPELPRDKLLGTWEYHVSQKPLVMMAFEFRKDGTLGLLAINERNNAREQREGKYEVTAETRDKVTVSVHWQDGQETAWEIEIVSDDQMRMHFLRTKADPVTYRRKR
jgi:uncharacterized protein (TIGR03066 family)